MGIALHIIARTPDEVVPLIEKYKEYFDEIDVAVDKDFKELEGANVYQYKWNDEEKELGFPWFDRKRNFLVDKCKQDWYFRLDTDDEIINPQNIKMLVERAEKENRLIVACYYDYARGEGGHTHAAHYRETIIRKHPNLYWNKHIHENILPKNGKPNTAINTYGEDAVSIKHHLDDKHAIESRDRNLKFLLQEYEKTKDNPDPRTLAYLGRMLYPMGYLKDAKYFLQEHIKKSGWDEDKCLSWCMLADIMLDEKNPKQAIACCYEAINERFDYPDPYLKLHWVYFTMKDYPKAIHWGKVGLSMKRPSTFMLQDPSSETWRPAVSMAESYLMMGDIENALKFFSIVKKYVPDLEWTKINEPIFADAAEQKKYVENFVWLLKYADEKDPEKSKELFKAIPKQLLKHEFLIKLRHKYVAPKKWADDEIVIYCGESWEEWAAPSVLKGIGGSEEAVIYNAKELAKLGYKVTVFTNCGDMAGEYEGVTYKQFYEFNPFDDYGVVIAWRGNIFGQIKAKKKIIWLHDVPIEGLLKKSEVDTYDKVMVLSEYHKSLLPDYIPESKVIVSANGINRKDFDIKKVPQRNFKRIIYTSSYDRGIEHLLKIWDDVLKEVPDAELHLFYGWDTYDAMMKRGARPIEFRTYMTQLMQKPNVFEHGRVNHKTLIKEFYKSGIYAYPSHFQEISCISAMKAQACGCVPIVFNYAALTETVKAGVKIDGMALDEGAMDKFKTELIKLLKDSSYQEKLRGEVLKHKEEFGWDKVAKQWHKELLPIKRHEYKTLDDYKKVYVTHKEFQPCNFDNGEPILFGRYKYVIDKIKELGIKSILDVGASDGALVYLINEQAKIKADGVEIDEKCVKFANEYAKEKNYNSKFYHNAIEEFVPEQKYGAVSFLEIIEHVMNPKEVLEKLESIVEDGGYVFITTPDKHGAYGESNFNPQHINFYDVKDLEELIGKDRIKDIFVENDLITLVYKK